MSFPTEPMLQVIHFSAQLIIIQWMCVNVIAKSACNGDQMLTFKSALASEKVNGPVRRAYLITYFTKSIPWCCWMLRLFKVNNIVSIVQASLFFLYGYAPKNMVKNKISLTSVKWTIFTGGLLFNRNGCKIIINGGFQVHVVYVLMKSLDCNCVAFISFTAT